MFKQGVNDTHDSNLQKELSLYTKHQNVDKDVLF